MKNISTLALTTSGIFLLIVEIFIVIPTNNPIMVSIIGTLSIGLIIAGSILSISRCNQVKEKQVDKKEKGQLI